MKVAVFIFLSCTIAFGGVQTLLEEQSSSLGLDALLGRVFSTLSATPPETKILFDNETQDLKSKLEKIVSLESTNEPKTELSFGDIQKHWPKVKTLSPEMKAKLLAVLKRISDSKFKEQSITAILSDLLKEDLSKNPEASIPVPKDLRDNWADAAKDDEEKLSLKSPTLVARKLAEKLDSQEKPSMKDFASLLNEIGNSLNQNLFADSSGRPKTNDFIAQLEQGSERSTPDLSWNDRPSRRGPASLGDFDSSFSNPPTLGGFGGNGMGRSSNRHSSIPKNNIGPHRVVIVGNQQIPSGQLQLIEPSFDGPVPEYLKATPITEAQVRMLKDGFKPQEKLSLEMSTQYTGSDKMAMCQAAAVARQPVAGSQNRCTYSFATALHCVSDEKHPLEKVNMGPFGALSEPEVVFRNLGGDSQVASVLARGATAIEVNQNGLDVALIHTVTKCLPDSVVTVYPTRMGALSSQDPLWIDTDRVHPALQNGKNDAGNVGVEVIDGGSIVQGNSGGGVIDTNGQWVGAVSSAYTKHNSFGYIASNDSLAWVNAGLEALKPPQGFPRQPVVPLATHKVARGSAR